MSIRTFILSVLGSFCLLTALRADHLQIFQTAEIMPTGLQGPFVVADDGAILCLENRQIHRSTD
ncbi:MAG: hypothetical protein IJG83_09675, partial [Thermoguttaceae bacterium]|nr:hypothetical protein [Thermoguttaceae bacterium]